MDEGEDAIGAFVTRWRQAARNERANYQLFIGDLCRLIGVDGPHPSGSDYSYEFAVTFAHPDGSTSQGRIDLYKRDCFVLEAKQGTEERIQRDLPLFGIEVPKDGGVQRGTRQHGLLMQSARQQAERYARSLPAGHEWPPFILTVDVGHSIECFADFSGTGRHYTQFPDAQRFRILLDDLQDDGARRWLAAIWTDPKALDPAKVSARVTNEVADHLAQLGRLLEARHPDPEAVAAFLMRCLFTMFAEDVGLLQKNCFARLLEEAIAGRRAFKPQVEELWKVMNRGGFEPWLGEKVLCFNGGLFADCSAFPLEREELGVLLEGARRDWSEVEPAIFGTLLERALDPRERHKLGAHYTPRAYVERLVMPTVIEPLRAEWADVQATAMLLSGKGQDGQALGEVERFHRRLCEVRVLDPACGTGNFLYVTMEHMKRLEGEVIDLARELGRQQDSLDLDRHTVSPEQFLGIELNARAAVIAELVIWIGYLQWHFKTRGNAQPSEPVLKNYKNIENRDAILAWDREELVCDAAGKPMTRWDGHTMKAHPVTGRAVPDEQAREEMVRYVRPCPAAWPAADFIVGNPPFQGGKDLRDVLGDGYAKALWKAHPEMPGSADLVMYWWGMAADRVRRGKAGRFGLITTNSLPQTFNRRVVERHLGDARAPLSLAFAIPDHPWVDEAGSANVRIAMTVGIAGAQEGKLQRVVDPMLKPGQGGDRLLQPETGKIAANLRLGADLTSVGPLMANEWLCSPGVKLHGAGFIVTPEQAAFLGLGTRPGLEDHILDYRNGRDLTARPRGVKVIDLFGLEPRDIQARFPEVYQWILERVKPERDGRAERSSTADAKEYARKWWLFGKPRSELRPALEGLERYIATVETAKHRLFMFLDARTRPDNMLVALASEDAAVLGVLSSRIHVVWAIAAGGRLGFGNDPRYNKTRCFDPFPFPAWSDEVKARVGDLAERLDAHRKRQQGQNPGLTMTGMYNVLEKLKTGEALTAKERADHERGLVSVLLDIHRELDAAVAGAYGWPADLSDEEVLARLVALNHERRAEEAAGTVRWLRPDYQIPKAGLAKPKGSQAEMDVGVAAGAAGKTPWPANLPDQVQAVRRLLAAGRPVDADLAGSAFKRAKRARVEEVLQTLAAMGQARPLGGGRYAR